MKPDIGYHGYITNGPSIVAVEITGVKKDKNGNRMYEIKQIIHDELPAEISEDSLCATSREAAERSLRNMGIS